VESEEEEKELITFIMIRRLLLLGWIASHMESDLVRNGIARGYTEGTVRLAQDYLAKMGL
jgi:hypothetical protein